MSQRHVIRQVVTGLRELLQRFLPGGAGTDTYVYLRSNAAESTGGGNGGGGGVQAGASLDAALTTRSDGDVLPPRDSAGFYPPCSDLPGAQPAEGLAPLDQQQDPFDLVMGDLDWRFNDNSFLWGIDTSTSYM